MWYLIFIHEGGNVYVHEYRTKKEALEEYRNGRIPTEIYYDGDKPEGIPIELADVIIRILDYCGKEKIDIGQALNIKHEYNKTRPYKHGGKVI